MSFEAAFILTVFVIPAAVGGFLHFWGWVTEERFYKHRRTMKDGIRDFVNSNL